MPEELYLTLAPAICCLLFLIFLPLMIIFANNDLFGVYWMTPPEDTTPIETKIRDGHVERGWKPHSWALRLRSLADSCEPYHPDAAADLRRWAESVERKHPRPVIEPPIAMPEESAVEPTKPKIVRY